VNTVNTYFHHEIRRLPIQKQEISSKPQLTVTAHSKESMNKSINKQVQGKICCYVCHCLSCILIVGVSGFILAKTYSNEEAVG
jgi:hypothetical protein